MPALPILIKGLLMLIGGAVGTLLLNTSTSMALFILVFFIMLLLRVLFMLMKAYVSIIFLIILGPILICFSALPGGDESGGVSMWLRSLLANILIFPVSALLIGIGGILNTRILQGTTVWQAPLLGGDKQFIAAAVSLGILVMLPEVDGMISKALMPKGGGLQVNMADLGKDLGGAIGKGLSSKK